MWTALRAFLQTRHGAIRQACRVLKLVGSFLGAVSLATAASEWRIDATFGGKAVAGAEVRFARATERRKVHLGTSAELHATP